MASEYPVGWIKLEYSCRPAPEMDAGCYVMTIRHLRTGRAIERGISRTQITVTPGGAAAVVQDLAQRGAEAMAHLIPFRIANAGHF